MFGSAILDVAIGLSFVYMLLSLLVTALQETAASLTNQRGRHLRKHLEEILDEVSSRHQEDTHLIEEIYNHPLLRKSRQRKVPLSHRKLKANGEQASSLAQWYHGLRRRADAPSYLSGRDFSRALLDVLHDDDDGLLDKQRMTELCSHDPTLERLLRPLLRESGDELHHVQEKLEEWYDDQMQRVSATYSRHSRLIAVPFGILIAFGLNVDSLAILDVLWSNQTLRGAVATQASTNASQAGTQTTQELQTQLSRLCIPIGWGERYDLCSRHPSKTHTEATAASDDSSNQAEAANPSRRGHFSHILGLIITTLAISLGAPFWFDLVNRLVKLRTEQNPDQNKAKAADS